MMNNLANRQEGQPGANKHSRCSSARKDYSGYANVMMPREQLESSFRRHDTQKVGLAQGEAVGLKTHLESTTR